MGIDYQTTWYYNGHDKEYNNYILITLTAKSGTKTDLGEIQTGEQQGTPVNKPARYGFGSLITNDGWCG